MSAQGAHLRAGQLGTLDVTASTVANIGPGIDFYFGFGIVAATAGVAAPLTIIAAGVATLLLAHIVSEFTRAEPSAGSFITYVRSAFGDRAGIVTSLLIAVGYTIAIAGVFAMSGGMLTLALAHYAHVAVAWEPISLVLTLGALLLSARGVSLSTRAVGVAVVLQVLVMIAVCAVVLLDQRAALSDAPFHPSNITGGLAGLSGGFPLALYMFIGWENGPALAEECRDPKRSIPRALYASILLTTALFVLFAYVTVTGFHYDVSNVGRASIPFLQMADSYLGRWAALAWVAGIISILATLVSAVNAQSRMIFDAGRANLLTPWLGRLSKGSDTPVNALWTMGGAGILIAAFWGAGHLSGALGGPNDPVALYVESSTMGTIVILVVYVLTALALPVFVRRRHIERFSPLSHVVIPALGVLSLAIPFFELCRPGQPFPYNVFPYLTLVLLGGAVLYARLRPRPDVRWPT